MENFAQRLYRARIQRGLSQTALAKASGLSQGAIASYENGTRKTTRRILELAEALQVNPVWLSSGVGSMFLSPAEASVPSLNLNDFSLLPAQADWPFSKVMPASYWSLSETQRHIVEDMVAALIKILNENKT